MNFGFDPGELFLIFAVVLLVLGASRIPELAESLANAINEFKSLF